MCQNFCLATVQVVYVTDGDGQIPPDPWPRPNSRTHDPSKLHQRSSKAQQRDRYEVSVLDDEQRTKLFFGSWNLDPDVAFVGQGT